MTYKIRAVALNMVLMCGTAAFCLVLLEIGLRIYNPFPFRVKGEKIILTGNRVETYRSSSPKLEPLIKVTRNALGFRGANPPADLDKHLSIVAIGGSTTECRFISDQNTWPAVVEQRLQGELFPVWLNNAGLDGHSTFGHLVLLSDHVLRIRPKVVLFLVGLNDQATTTPKTHDRAQLKGIHNWSPWHFTVQLVRNSELASTVYNLYRYSLARKAQLAWAYPPDITRMGTAEVPEQRISEEVARNERLYIPSYRGRLMELVSICKEHGILPVLITQPLLWGSGIDDVTGVNLETIVPSERAGNGKLEWKVLEVYNRTTLEVAHSAGALVIDLAHKLPKSSRLFYDCCHYTLQGAKEAGNIIAAELGPWLAHAFPHYTISRKE
jgi:hypothetical protein